MDKYNSKRQRCRFSNGITNNKIIIVKLGIPLLVIIGLFLCPRIAFQAEISKQKIVDITNKKRTEYNTDRLRLNNRLSKAAREKATSILKEQIFKHNINGNDFIFWIKNSGYKYERVGENLAIDFLHPQDVIDGWMKSSSHRKNLLNPEYQEIGVAILKGKYQQTPTTLVVQIFGTPENRKISNPEDTQHPSRSFSLENISSSTPPL